jgi:hypothetical protein
MGRELGRISGPLLADNLKRNGTDLTFENSLLYLNVNTSRIGINSVGPSSDLTIGTLLDDGTTGTSLLNTVNLSVTTTTNIGNFTISSSTIQHLTDGITLSPNQASNPTINVPGLSTSSLYFSNNTLVTTVTNDPINITPDGANGGITSVVSSVDVSAIYNRTLPVVQSGGSNATIYFGTGAGIGTNATIVTSGKGYIPGLATVTYNSITYNVNIVSVVTTGGNINFANDAGNVAVTVNASLHATGNITFDGNIQLGDNISDRITFVAEVNSDLLPVATQYLTVPNASRLLAQSGNLFAGIDDESLFFVKPNTPQYSYTPLYDLGSNSLNWNNLWSTSLDVKSSATSSITATTANIGNISIINNTINNQLNDIVFNPTGTGQVKFNGTQYINGNNIQNTSNGEFTLNGTGFGYIKFSGTNGVVFPVGSTGTRPSSRPTGTFRFNTDLGYGELWNGTAWIPVGGAADVLTQAQVTDAVYTWDLILG